MAGIGLRLQDVMAKGTYLQSLTAYLSSAVISSGPWLSSVIALSVLSTSSVAFLTQDARMLLFATITYCFAISLIVSSAPQMIVTRYLADRLYVEDLTNVAPTCTGLIASVVPLTIISIPFLIFAPFTMPYRVLVVSLCITLTAIWLVAVFLSAGRDYFRILLIFIISYVISILAAIVLGKIFGVTGSLAGFLSGQIVCLSLLIARIYREFSPNDGISFDFLRYIGKYWDLGAIGILYAIGIWSDNTIYWFSPLSHNTVIAGFFHLSQTYDSAKLIAYMTTIPASATFLVHLESNFYRHYKGFFRCIREKDTLAHIAIHKNGMIEAAHAGLVNISLIQGSLAALLYLLAPNLAAVLQTDPSWIQTVRTVTVGASLQIVMFSIFILLLYLDERLPVLIITGSFLIFNIVGSLISLNLGPSTFGMGYLIGACVAMAIGLYFLTDRLRRLDYLTFMTQPIQ
jgi:polysaccharide biosynthesis protein PelG